MHFDHIYRETHYWDDSLVWWMNLGYSMVERWGEDPHRAAKLRSGDMVVVLAESAPGETVRQSMFIATHDLADIADRTGRTIVNTHWGTEMVSAEDPDGRSYNFETRNEDG